MKYKDPKRSRDALYFTTTTGIIFVYNFNYSDSSNDVVRFVGRNTQPSYTANRVVSAWRKNKTAPEDRILETERIRADDEKNPPSDESRWFSKSVEVPTYKTTDLVSEYILEYIDRYINGWLIYNIENIFDKSPKIHITVSKKETSIVIKWNKQMDPLIIAELERQEASHETFLISNHPQTYNIPITLSVIS